MNKEKINIEPCVLEIGVGGFKTYLGENHLTRILREEVYERLNNMAIMRLGRMNMENLLNTETDEKWCVIFIQSENSMLSNHRYIFIRVSEDENV
jgi:hypothetical protein